MLPTLQRHLGRHVASTWLGMTFLCLMLSFALVRNSQSLRLSELLIAGVAIAVGVTYGVTRDAPGYWIYSTLVAKFIMSKEEIAQIRDLQPSPVISWLNPLQTPYAMPLLAAIAMFFVLSIGDRLLPRHSTLLALSVIGVLLPLALSWMLLRSARYYIVLASPEGEALIGKGTRGPRRVNAYRREDMWVALLINFALIWPLQSKPAFSLDAGYGSRDFMVASILLTWIAAFFTLLSARRSRLLSVVGERLSQLFNHDAVVVDHLPPRSALRRMLVYYALLGTWSLSLCLFLGSLPTEVPFALYCSLLLPALGAVFWYERGLTLRCDSEQAMQFISEQTVQPVASLRRMSEFN
jgi:hypothetical protein